MYTNFTGMNPGRSSADMEERKLELKSFHDIHRQHQGELIRYGSEGSLSLFARAQDAIRCGIALQKESSSAYCIALHLGDLEISKEDVLGEGVQIANGMHKLKAKGGLLLSRKISEQFKAQKTEGYEAHTLGYFLLNKVARPVEVFALSGDYLLLPESQHLHKAGTSGQKSIAVLPFVNFSKNPDSDYFSDGITEEIINALARIPGLKVTSRTSSFQFKNQNASIVEIGEKLNVSAILEGSIRLAGDMVRITAQLIHAVEDFHFWSETWDRRADNIFEIQDEISLLIAEKLREHYGHFDIQEHLVEKQTENFDAYSYYLKGRYLHNKWNPEDMQEAILLFEKALALDPEHVQSYTGLADCYGFLATTGFLPYDESWEKVATLTDKALELNPQNAEAYYQRSNLAFFVNSDYKASFTLMQEAIRLNPNYAEAQQFMAFLYIISKEEEKAGEHLELARKINPLSQETLFFTGYYYYCIHSFEKALEILDECLENNKRNIPAHTIKCYCLLKLGRYDEVLHYFASENKELMVKDDVTGLTALAYAYMQDESKMDEYLKILEGDALKPEGFRANSYLLLIYAITGQFDRAFEWIQRAIENKFSFLLFHFNDPLLEPLRPDSRFAEVHQTIYEREVMRTEKAKKKELLGKDAAKKLTLQLLRHMEEEAPYLDTALSLRSLARQLGVHPNQLSWLLNESIGKSFSEFVNHYRVQAFKSIAGDPGKSHITLIGLAYESGFNSKTVFNTFFKKATGMTPKQYLQTKA